MASALRSQAANDENPGCVIKTLAKAAIFLVLCLVAVEQAYRTYSIGITAWRPALFNSYNILLQTDFVELAEYPDIYYQLKANTKGWFQGNRLLTNSAGLADYEYSRKKPAGTLRVAVVGSSWTMATGVAQESSWHAQLERDLNEAYPGRHFEFINFGVEYYGLREVVATVRHRVPKWDPDVIHIDLTSFTAYLLWESPPANLPLPDKTSPFLQSFALRALDANLEAGFFSQRLPQRPTVGLDMNLAHAQVIRAIREVHALAASQQIPVIVSWLSFGRPGAALLQELQQVSAELGLIFIPAYKSIQQRGLRKGAKITAKHPDSETHAVIANLVRKAMAANNLLPLEQ